MSELNEIERGQLCQSTIESLYEASASLSGAVGDIACSAGDQDSASSSRPSRDFNSSVPYLLNFLAASFVSVESQTSPQSMQSADSAFRVGCSVVSQAGANSSARNNGVFAAKVLKAPETTRSLLQREHKQLDELGIGFCLSLGEAVSAPHPSLPTPAPACNPPDPNHLERRGELVLTQLRQAKLRPSRPLSEQSPGWPA